MGFLPLTGVGKAISIYTPKLLILPVFKTFENKGHKVHVKGKYDLNEQGSPIIAYYIFREVWNYGGKIFIFK